MTEGHAIGRLWRGRAPAANAGAYEDHLRQATLPETRVPEDAARLPHPLLGYYGVIDERMDYDAIRSLSAAFPQGTVLQVLQDRSWGYAFMGSVPTRNLWKPSNPSRSPIACL